MYSGSSGGGYYESRSSSYGRDSYSERHRTNSGYHPSSSTNDRYRYPSRSSHRTSSSPTRVRDITRHHRSPSPSPGPSHSRYDAQRRYDSPPPTRQDRHREKERHTSPTSNRKDSEERRRPAVEDNRNVLERMEKSFSDGPLEVLKRCMKDKTRIKIWTRNFKEVRGICTGYVLAFDKHWNLIMRDVDEIYLRPRKGKNPFLRELKSGEADLIPEMKNKVPKEKKKDSVQEKNAVAFTSHETTDESSEKMPAQFENTSDILKKKEKQKEKRRKKKAPLMCKRHVGQLFIRGDNVVMAAVIVDNGSDSSSPKKDESVEREEDSQE